MGFREEVYEIVKRIPAGKVATYGQIATLLGKPKSARAVGNALHKNPFPDEVPCYRVVNAGGYLADNFAFGGKMGQARLLSLDGIEVTDGRVNIGQYLWVSEQ